MSVTDYRSLGLKLKLKMSLLFFVHACACLYITYISGTAKRRFIIFISRKIALWTQLVFAGGTFLQIWPLESRNNIVAARKGKKQDQNAEKVIHL